MTITTLQQRLLDAQGDLAREKLQLAEAIASGEVTPEEAQAVLSAAKGVMLEAQSIVQQTFDFVEEILNKLG
jgi:hypothetical protein